MRNPSTARWCNFRRLSWILLRNVIVDERLKCNGKLIISAFERDVFLSVDVNRAAWRFASARQADADVRGLRLPRTVDDAPHHREGHLFNAFILRLPDRHAVADVALDRLGQFLER